MSIFRFQKFCVRNEKSAMKVNTDGVLLGALMTIKPESPHLLDIGTGTGTIALMAAQRMDAIPGPGGCNGDGHPYMIDGIDIDGPSAEEAAMNFASSPWSGRLLSHHIPLSDFAAQCQVHYDHIFSNPPFFLEELHSPDSRKAVTRHADSLPLEDILDFAAARLNPDGHLSLILPYGNKTMAVRAAAERSLFPFSILDIRPTEKKPPHRCILEFSGQRNDAAAVSMLTIHKGNGYSEEYLRITAPYLCLGK
ncbi:MAG: tRNA1(Val) (adenine(37)-N6)-methyltransferase [Candidatus Cryptobacteroides sp.]